MLNGLTKLFPDLEEKLKAIIERLVDLLPIIQNNVYHPELRGSFSIKKVLPALVPAFHYRGLAIQDGDTAVACFAKMARGEIEDELIQSVREDLLTYCKMDTLAMVKMHEVMGKTTLE